MSEQHDYLRRLPKGYYTGHTFIHWAMTVHERATGWLSEAFHLRFREWLTHALFLEKSTCAVYCLMPDHVHLLTLGVSVQSNQLRLMAFLRTQINSGLKRIAPPCRLQKQAYDHVLTEKERARNAFQKVAHYIAENPVRAGLVDHASAYPHTGALVPGYPELDFWSQDYWNRFWRTYVYLRKKYASNEA